MIFKMAPQLTWFLGPSLTLIIALTTATGNDCPSPYDYSQLASEVVNFNPALTTGSCLGIRSTTYGCQAQVRQVPIDFVTDIDWLANTVKLTGENLECQPMTFALKESCLEGGNSQNVYTECELEAEGDTAPNHWCEYACVCQTSCTEGMASYGHLGGPDTATLCNAELIPV